MIRNDYTVKLIDCMGTDLKVVNAARRSFNNTSETLDAKGVGLIKYLGRGLKNDEMAEMINELSITSDKEQIKKTLVKWRRTPEHWTPFAHCQVTFHIEMPIFVARQLIRSTVGVVISEMSRRYFDGNPDYYLPGEWRLAADDVKQGSSSSILPRTLADEVDDKMFAFYEQASALYRDLVDNYGIAAEQARIVLPVATYTDWYWTASLVTVARVCKQRLDSHAQKEIQLLAKPLSEEMEKLFPVSWKALMNYGIDLFED